MTKRTPEQIVYDCINNIDPTECGRCESVDLSVTITETTFESSDGRILPGNKKKEIRCNTCKNLLQTGPATIQKIEAKKQSIWNTYDIENQPREETEILISVKPNDVGCAPGYHVAVTDETNKNGIIEMCLVNDIDWVYMHLIDKWAYIDELEIL